MKFVEEIKQHPPKVLLKRATSFLTVGIWRMQYDNLSKGSAFLLQIGRIVLLAARGFKKDLCYLRASALTFYTMLSIVPLWAMAFGIAQGFGLEDLLEKTLQSQLQGQTEALDSINKFANQLLETTRSTSGGLMAVIGVAILFWTVIKVLENIELSFNAIWDIKKHRPLIRKINDYTSIMIVAPILIILASSITIFLAGFIEDLAAKIPFLNAYLEILQQSLKLLSFFVTWTLFSFIYISMPNKKVSPASGIIGGIIAGTTYQMIQWVYITFQIGVAKFGAIYGSFAALPLFLGWLQISWIIVLLGAEIAFAHENEKLFEFEKDTDTISIATKELLGIYILQTILKTFAQGKPPLSAIKISEKLGTPLRLTNILLAEYTEMKLITTVIDEETDEIQYHPYYQLEHYTMDCVIHTLHTHGSSNLPVKETDELKKLWKFLESRSKIDEILLTEVSK